MITKQTAYEICLAYNEIEHGEQLLKDLEELRKDGKEPNLRDVFGRPRGLQLGVPSGKDSHRIFDVSPVMGVAVITTHIAAKQQELFVLNERARIELQSQSPLI